MNAHHLSRIDYVCEPQDGLTKETPKKFPFLSINSIIDSTCKQICSEFKLKIK